jgi:hypothetical protein
MKKLFLFPVLLFLGCAPAHHDSNHLKQDADGRHELYATIINDGELLGEFLNQLVADEAGALALLGHREAIYRVFEVENLYLMIQERPELMLILANNLSHIISADSMARSMMVDCQKTKNAVAPSDGEVARK